MSVVNACPNFCHSPQTFYFLTPGYSKCVLIGHDWGGMIAWLIAICYPEMIMKLIVINFPHPSVFTGNASFPIN
ncbi:hypothetical protein A6R68_13329 [Neotoma lepida]|uniref:AB hydrolase-1 domain-containing protein n=1 Tax=Neotoma lepida TaxID=56216 RepID=A0A1A6H3A5_NEOLE|nr:hypothetical protein A6R68_13329 [Neotoma lepida]